jgi:hypothetical protein
MPYKVVHDEKACSASKPWAVKKKDDNRLMGCHPTKEAALRQVAALEAQESTTAAP